MSRKRKSSAALTRASAAVSPSRIAACPIHKLMTTADVQNVVFIFLGGQQAQVQSLNVQVYSADANDNPLAGVVFATVGSMFVRWEAAMLVRRSGSRG